MRYNRYGDNFLIDMIQPDELGEELLSVGELVADDEWQITLSARGLLHIRARNRSGAERRENTNLRILE